MNRSVFSDMKGLNYVKEKQRQGALNSIN